MIYDCFSFFNENALLELRLNTLKDIVDKFIIIEANKTHAGKPKSQNFNKEFLKQFPDKIIYVFLEDIPELQNPWAYENYQRNHILNVLKEQNCAANDIIIITNLDEIPSPAAIEMFHLIPDSIAALNQQFYCYYLNLLNCSEPLWDKGRILEYKELFNPNHQIPQKINAIVKELNQTTTPTTIRFAKTNCFIKDGWHFSYIGGAETVKYKLENFAHQEYNTPQHTDISTIKGCLNNCEDVIGRDLKLEKVELDNSFPKYLLENQDKYKEFILA